MKQKEANKSSVVAAFELFQGRGFPSVLVAKSCCCK